MKEFSCGDVVPGCTAVFTGADEQQVLEQVAVHARRDHGIETISDDLVMQVRALMRELPAA